MNHQCSRSIVSRHSAVMPSWSSGPSTRAASRSVRVSSGGSRSSEGSGSASVPVVGSCARGSPPAAWGRASS
ncbi:hypothetical protein [Ornithinimicrobium kibberense]|uniref:hypothetical protein n=1 Tax=Ornithinimicrobium kibberense TaxID=282060 RepID=UPI00361992D1